ncbi:ABC transporter permease [Mycetocola tolaasinivorans]|uniref:ABC transporter permease n=1 Tax=Mycetocola tolaasinivorans TaxID=76635 RepID=A0A3L7A8B4_9MICO|nr:ABC transporter permease [Mycetocola tolaasinivorans]RLP76407.1 ABC transporter permease [Mycetocola tolaasinivorans]
MSNSNYTPGPGHYVAPLEDTPLAAVDAVSVDEKPSNLWTDAWQDLRGRVSFWISLALILLVAVVAIFPQLFTSVAPDACDLDNSNGGSEPGHLLGFTMQGCDVYSRIIHGTSTSVSVGLIVTVLVFTLGLVFGAISGFYGGWVDSVLSRAGDIFFSIPYILAAIVIMSQFKAEDRNVWVISLAIGLFAWPSTARVLRAEIIRVKQADFITSAKSIGLSNFKILIRHVLPNSIAPVIVITTLSLAGAIVAEATLSYLGVGLPTTIMSWGNDIGAAQDNLRNSPMTLIYPSIALSVTVLAFIMLGEAVRDALDPKARARR